MSIQNLRKQIDYVDEHLLKLIAKREAISSRIGKIKEEQSIAVYDAAREQFKIKQIKKSAKKLGIDEEFACKLMNSIMEHSKSIQFRNRKQERK